MGRGNRRSSLRAILKRRGEDRGSCRGRRKERGRGDRIRRRGGGRVRIREEERRRARDEAAEEARGEGRRQRIGSGVGKEREERKLRRKERRDWKEVGVFFIKSALFTRNGTLFVVFQSSSAASSTTTSSSPFEEIVFICLCFVVFVWLAADLEHIRERSVKGAERSLWEDVTEEKGRGRRRRNNSIGTVLFSFFLFSLAVVFPLCCITSILIVFVCNRRE